MTIRRTTTAGVVGIALAACSSFVSAEPPQGLYSADQLLDADVYASGADKRVGEIEDIVLDNNMRIQSFVVETDGRFGLGGKSYVLAPGEITVETTVGDQMTEPKYRFTLNMDAEQLASRPEYNDTWWKMTKNEAGDAWEQTKDSARNAWTRIREGTADLIGGTGDAAEETGEVIDNSADNAGDTVDDTTN